MTASLDAAYEQVLAHAYFSSCSRAELTSCERFCALLRSAPIAVVKELFDALETIAYATDDANEASGFLIALATFGGGLTEPPPSAPNASPTFANLGEARTEIDLVPVENEEAFSQWIRHLPAEKKSLAYTAAMDALAKRVMRIAPDDYPARLVHCRMFTVLFYSLASIDTLLRAGNYAAENLQSSFDVRDQLPNGLWWLFNSRPEADVKALIDKWWGPAAETPSDFFIALEWQREGYISIHKGRHYYETVAEFLLNYCEPSAADCAPVRSNYGIEALQRDPFLAEDFYAGLADKQAYRYLVSYDIPHRAAYLNALFAAGVLQRAPVIAALEHGIGKKWDRQGLPYYVQLKEAISA